MEEGLQERAPMDGIMVGMMMERLMTGCPVYDTPTPKSTEDGRGKFQVQGNVILLIVN